MAAACVPDEVYETVAHHRPPERPSGPTGGRPRGPHRVVLRAFGLALAAGTRWGDVPPGPGGPGRTAHRRPRAWEGAGIRDRRHAGPLRLLRPAGEPGTGPAVVGSAYVRAFGGGEGTGPRPVDRRELGTEPALAVSRSGPPPAVCAAGLRRVRVRCDRRGVVRGALTAPAASVTCFRGLVNDAM